eukprot:scaffold9421_cov51-Phaeocystis_antarctica.AAC.1
MAGGAAWSKCPLGRAPARPPAPPQGAPEPAASKAADSTTVDHSGGAGRDRDRHRGTWPVLQALPAPGLRPGQRERPRVLLQRARRLQPTGRAAP